MYLNLGEVFSRGCWLERLTTKVNLVRSYQNDLDAFLFVFFFWKKKAKTSIHLMLTIACFQYFAFLIPLVKEFYFVLKMFGN